jgi:phosphoribosylformylglycinamidine (FGAM) synthase-like enzyme
VESSQTTNCRTFAIAIEQLWCNGLDYNGKEGVATPLIPPIASLIDPVAGTRTAIAESSSTLFGHSIKGGLDGISLANWMWACKKKEKMLVCTQLFKVVRICNRIRE